MKRFLLKLFRLEKKYCWEPTWLYTLKCKLNGFISNIVWHCFARFEIGRLIISSICEAEINVRYFFNKKYREWYELSDWTKEIPKDTFYCSGCSYRCGSHIAYWLLGRQSYGYCFFINRGDFSYINPTMLLHDGCKECGEYQYDEFEEDGEE